MTHLFLQYLSKTIKIKKKTLTQNIPLSDGIQKTQRITLNPIVSICRIQGLQQIPDMSDVNPGLPHRVRLLNNLNHGPLFEPFDIFQLGKIVERVPVQLERETRSVARIFSVHEQLVNFLHELHAGHLDIKGFGSRADNFDCEAHVLDEDDFIFGF